MTQQTDHPNKMMTAVEWYAKAHQKLLVQLENKELSVGSYAGKHYDIIQQAKQMEKEQIINFFLFFRNNGEKYLGMTIEQFVEQYYNETYKNK